MIHRDHRHDVQEKSPALDAEVEAVSSERFELLARKHGSGAFTSQDQEHLDSLDSRLRCVRERNALQSSLVRLDARIVASDDLERRRLLAGRAILQAELEMLRVDLERLTGWAPPP